MYRPQGAVLEPRFREEADPFGRASNVCGSWGPPRTFSRSARIRSAGAGPPIGAGIELQACAWLRREDTDGVDSHSMPASRSSARGASAHRSSSERSRLMLPRIAASARPTRSESARSVPLATTIQSQNDIAGPYRRQRSEAEGFDGAAPTMRGEIGAG